MNTAERPKDRTFQTVLRQKGISEPSPAIPDDVGQHLQGVPAEEDLVPIPEFEEFPLAEPPQAADLPAEKVAQQFCQYQLQSIAANPLTNTSSLPGDQTCVGPILEIPTEFDTIEDFVKFKRELATVFKARSDAYGWSESVGVCKFPTCANSVAPSFEYCLFHLPLDPHFEDQGFVGRCKVITDERQCEIPCGKNGTKCAFHRALGRETGK